jgi:hypothetical protein
LRRRQAHLWSRAVAGGGGILDAQRQVTWQRGGREQTGGGVLDARRRVTWQSGDKGRIGSYTKLCDFTLLFMILQVELRLNKGSLVRPRLVDQVKARASIMTICEH